MKFTHRKKTYYATCLQWDGKNTAMIIELLDRAGCDAHHYGGELMLKWRSNEVKYFAAPMLPTDDGTRYVLAFRRNCTLSNNYSIQEME